MPTVRDMRGAPCSVYRRWWPYRLGLLRGPMMSGDGAYDLVQLVIALLFLLSWPFWLVTRVLGAPWTVVVVRGGRLVHSERVAGWRASQRRIADLLAGVQSDGVSLPDAGSPTG